MCLEDGDGVAVSVSCTEEEVVIGLHRGLRNGNLEGGRSLFLCNRCGIGRKGRLDELLDDGTDVNTCYFSRGGVRGVWGANAVGIGIEKADVEETTGEVWYQD